MSPAPNRIRHTGPRIFASASLAIAGVATLLGVFGAGATQVNAASKQYAVYTSVQNIDDNTECPNGGGNGVDCNIYNSKTEVFLNGGPASDFLPDGEYCFSVYAPNGKDLLSSDQASNRAFGVASGVITYGGSHATGLDSRELPATATIGFFPFDDTPNPGGEYKFALYKYESPVTHSGTECNQDYDIRKTDNFKVKGEDEPTPPPPTTEDTPVSIQICKVVVDNGDADVDGGTFGFAYDSSSDDGTFNLVASETSGEVCKSLTLPEGGRISAEETALPAGWDNAPGYPKVKLNDGAQKAGNGEDWYYEDGDKLVVYNSDDPTPGETPTPPPTQETPPPPTTEDNPPPTETPAPPTETPPTQTPPTQTPSPTQQPEENVAGVIATPMAPIAGTGVAQEGGHSMNFLLIIVGALAASLGLGSLAMDSRRK